MTKIVHPDGKTKRFAENISTIIRLEPTVSEAKLPRAGSTSIVSS